MDNPLEGDLVRLRAKEPEDEPLFHQWVNDPEVTRHLVVRYPMSHAQERDYTATPVTYQNATFAVVRRHDDTLIGNVTLRRTSPENRSAELGLMIGAKECWGQGYGTDAVRTVCRFGFGMMNLHRIELEVFAGNDRARRIYDRLGFREEAVRREAHFAFGRYTDAVIMGLLEGELQ